MSEKKELNQEQLEKVSGGKIYNCIESVKWIFSKNDIVQVKLEDSNATLVTGKVTKRGVDKYPGVFYVTDVYYIESTENSSVNGWYLGDSFSNKVVSIYNRVNGTSSIVVVNW